MRWMSLAQSVSSEARVLAYGLIFLEIGSWPPSLGNGWQSPAWWQSRRQAGKRRDYNATQPRTRQSPRPAGRITIIGASNVARASRPMRCGVPTAQLFSHKTLAGEWWIGEAADAGTSSATDLVKARTRWQASSTPKFNWEAAINETPKYRFSDHLNIDFGRGCKINTPSRNQYLAPNISHTNFLHIGGHYYFSLPKTLDHPTLECAHFDISN